MLIISAYLVALTGMSNNSKTLYKGILTIYPSKSYGSYFRASDP